MTFEQFENFIVGIRHAVKQDTGAELITLIIKFMERELQDKYEYIYSWIYDCEDKQMTILEDGKPIYIDNDKDLYDYFIAHLPKVELPTVKGKKKK